VPAVPSSTGVADVFAFQNDGTVQAITADGTTAWTATVSNGIPDFQGGLIDWHGGNGGTGYIRKLDGLTGQPYPSYIPTGNWTLTAASPVVHPDGTIFAVREQVSGYWDKWDVVVGIDPLTGTEKFSVALPEITDGASPQYQIIIAVTDSHTSAEPTSTWRAPSVPR
jgi:hypothetical protein